MKKAAVCVRGVPFQALTHSQGCASDADVAGVCHPFDGPRLQVEAWDRVQDAQRVQPGDLACDDPKASGCVG